MAAKSAGVQLLLAFCTSALSARVPEAWASWVSSATIALALTAGLATPPRVRIFSTWARYLVRASTIEALSET